MRNGVNNMSLWLAILLLVIGFALLIWGADFFVDGASRVAARLKIPQIVIGVNLNKWNLNFSANQELTLNGMIFGKNNVCNSYLI